MRNGSLTRRGCTATLDDMSWYGDPDELDRLATRLEVSAARVRRRAGSVRETATATHWRGPAADAFHAAVHREVGLLDRAAAELDDAAAAMRRHADRVRHEIARIRAAERAAEALLTAGLSTLERVVT